MGCEADDPRPTNDGAGELSSDRFFEETREQSQVKSAIVSKYFWAWAKVIIPTAKKHGGKIAYLDLFAGPGRYKDGTKSTPVLVVEQAIKDLDLRNMLVTVFNDKDDGHTRELERALADIQGVDTLRFKPQVRNDEVGDQMVKMFRTMSLVPSLFFVDPWGYKGLSLDLVNAVVKDWGCDCIFFFNYNRISMGLTNPVVEEHMDALFGQARAPRIREALGGLGPADREIAIVEALCEALNEPGNRYVLPFRFRDERGTRTSHHLIFVSKSFKGYEIMKEIMAKESSKQDQGVPSFEYNPADRRYKLLFELTRPLDDLADMLLKHLSGRTLTTREVFEQHNVGRPYISRNYKEALGVLEVAKRIQTSPSTRRKGTFADHVRVTFP